MQTEFSPTSEDLDPNHRPYQPHGASLSLFYCRDGECLLSGPAGTGKSLSILAKIYLCCEKYPGIRCLVARKTRESMTESVLVTWEDRVLPHNSPLKFGASRENRRSYKFPNGSEVIIGGLRQSNRDCSQKIMSTEYDIIYIAEAIELSEEEWEKLLTRLRNNKMPYQQLLGDTNPSYPTHWLKKRCERGQTTYLESRHEDNPTLYDNKAGKYTEWGKTYLSKLDGLTGPRKLRLRHGKWAQAEGIVYESWAPERNVIAPFDIPPDWRRILVVDFGYTNSFVAQWFGIDGDDRAYLYREWVRSKMLVEDHAKKIKILHGTEPKPEAVVCDHDAEDRATLERHLGWSTTAATKDVQSGIQELSSRMLPAGDGKPRFFVFEGALVSRDPNLEEAKKPCGFLEEIDGYIWQEETSRGVKEEPLKLNDHSMDAARYAAMYLRKAVKWVAPTPIKPKEAKSWLPGKTPRGTKMFGLQ